MLASAALASAALAASPSDSGTAFDYRQTALSRWRCLESDLGAELHQFAQNRSLSRLLEVWQACEELHFTSVDEELATHLAAGLELRATASAAAAASDTGNNISALRLLNLDGGALRSLIRRWLVAPPLASLGYGDHAFTGHVAQG